MYAVSSCFSISHPAVEPEPFQKENDVSLRNVCAHCLQIIRQQQICSYALYTQP
jgi:hypothetical protein